MTGRVGGGFGAKVPVYQEDTIVPMLARRLDRPVRWAATRREDMQMTGHGRDMRCHLRLAADATGLRPRPRREDHRQCRLLPLSRRLPPPRAVRADDHRLLRHPDRARRRWCAPSPTPWAPSPIAGRAVRRPHISSSAAWTCSRPRSTSIHLSSTPQLHPAGQVSLRDAPREQLRQRRIHARPRPRADSGRLRLPGGRRSRRRGPAAASRASAWRPMSRSAASRRRRSPISWWPTMGA